MPAHDERDAPHARDERDAPDARGARELVTNRCACGWEVSGPIDEVVAATIDHGARIHNMVATRDDVLAAMGRTPPADEGTAEAG